ncbi:MAG: hypothetical protein QG671_2707 [Actinomycetota bacterium]|nr:hypothetical protein [Actinomycetota bacterium]
MSTALAVDTGPRAGGLAALETPDDVFARQPTPTEELPDPLVVVPRLAQAIIDVMAGQRPVSQLMGCTSTAVYAQLAHLSSLAAETPSSARLAWHRHRVLTVRVTQPAAGVVEASAVVRNQRRGRALALRLEGLDGRWRCTAVSAG